jgi:hypothetical protein
MIQHRSSSVVGPSGIPVPADEYRIVFEGSCTFWVYYDLVAQLDTSITRIVSLSAFASNSTQAVRIPVTTGKVIGKIGGQTLDLGVANSEITLSGFVVPSHYDYEPWKVHTVDAFDYLDEPARSQSLALDRRTIAPRGGRIDNDIDGKAVGNWFLQGTRWYQGVDMSRYWVGHLALAYDKINPSVIVISLGNYKNATAQFAVKGNAPDPASVDASSGVVVYELTFLGPSLTPSASNAPVLGVLLVQVLANRQLRIQVFPDRTRAEVSGFDSGALIYER